MACHAAFWAVTASSFVALGSAQNNFVCPDDSGDYIQDVAGYRYQLECATDTSGVSSTSPSATNSFNDCFALCESTSDCTSFTYIGGANGVGGGTCYLKSGSLTFTNEGTAGDNTVAAIMVADLPAAYTGPSWIQCPQDNNSVVTDPNGVQYVIGCGADSSPTQYDSIEAQYGFDDCFAPCSNGSYPDSSNTPSTPCNGFTYIGGGNGLGAGNCSLKSGSVPYGFVTESSDDYVAAIALADYSAAAGWGSGPTSTVVAPSSTTTPTSYLVATASSAASSIPSSPVPASSSATTTTLSSVTTSSDSSSPSGSSSIDDSASPLSPSTSAASGTTSSTSTIPPNDDAAPVSNTWGTTTDYVSAVTSVYTVDYVTVLNTFTTTDYTTIFITGTSYTVVTSTAIVTVTIVTPSPVNTVFSTIESTDIITSFSTLTSTDNITEHSTFTSSGVTTDYSTQVTTATTTTTSYS